MSQMSVQIAIDSYDDLFSDFDIRDYRERYISSDLLNELRMRTNKVAGRNGIDLVFIIDSKERSAEAEDVIAKRLRVFFDSRHERNKSKKNSIIMTMAAFEIIGMAFLLMANVLEKYTFPYLKEFLLIPSWFFIWNGLERYLNNRKSIDRNIKYYSKLRRSRIVFRSEV